MKFSTAINCMDGRVQEQVIQYLKDKYGTDYVDMITEPGPNRILAEQSASALVDSIFARINISVEKHGSKQIAVIGHHDCAGNPVGEEEQKKHTFEAVRIVREKYPELEVVGLWVGESWNVTEI
ncbi:MAG: carbonic anhydrase [Acidobacteriota bacterium]